MRLIHSFVGLLALGALGLGCSETPPPQAPPPPTPHVDKAATPRLLNQDPGRSAIVIDEKLAALCDMPAAYFDFDSSALSDVARSALDTLASCFTIGPARGKAMSIVGHADPRGELEYNFALGQRRAGAVVEHLVARGVGELRIESSSRGELDADGFDEVSWARDRKVEISLAE
jgi:peptidoglycan-associated lipoprotein